MSVPSTSLKTVVCGIRHRQADLAIREQIAMTPEQVAEVLLLLKANPAVAGAAMLTTCNRTECYAVGADIATMREAIWQSFEKAKQLPPQALTPFSFTLTQEDSILYLFRVAAGLDSLIVGEGQILNQVKDAQHQASALETQHPVLQRWFQTAITVGKRVRTETGIARKDISVSRAAFDAMSTQVPEWQSKKIAVVGGGRMASLLINSLQRALPVDKKPQITLVNRSPLRLQQLVKSTGFKGVLWEEAGESLAQSDIMLVATAAPHYLFHAQDFDVLTAHNPAQRWIADLSVPRNVDPAVGLLPHVTVVNTDDLCGQNPLTADEHQRLQEAAGHIMAEAYQQFYQWQLSRAAIPTITRLRQQAEKLQQTKLKEASPFSRQMMNTWLHQPTVALKQASTPNQLAQTMAVVDKLFGFADDAKTVQR